MRAYVRGPVRGGDMCPLQVLRSNPGSDPGPILALCASDARCAVCSFLQKLLVSRVAWAPGLDACQPEGVCVRGVVDQLFTSVRASVDICRGVWFSASAVVLAQGW